MRMTRETKLGQRNRIPPLEYLCALVSVKKAAFQLRVAVQILTVVNIYVCVGIQIDLSMLTSEIKRKKGGNLKKTWLQVAGAGNKEVGTQHVFFHDYVLDTILYLFNYNLGTF